MRSTLYAKFIFIYIIFGFLSIFCVEALTKELLQSRLETLLPNASEATRIAHCNALIQPVYITLLVIYSQK